jgi:hypothetical protein
MSTVASLCIRAGDKDHKGLLSWSDEHPARLIDAPRRSIARIGAASQADGGPHGRQGPARARARGGGGGSEARARARGAAALPAAAQPRKLRLRDEFRQ